MDPLEFMLDTDAFINQLVLDGSKQEHLSRFDPVFSTWQSTR